MTTAINSLSTANDAEGLGLKEKSKTVKIPVCEPSIGDDELALVTEAVKSGWVSSRGKFIEEFESLFSNYCETKYGIAVSSGTAAIHLALACIGVKEGDEVIIPSLTMIATAYAAMYLGAKPVPVDSEKRTWNIDPAKIEEGLSDRTKAIVVVHLYGHPCDMDPILEIAEKHGLYVIEDAAEAHGAEYKGKKTGGLGHIGCFSFYANKIITTGEGGMIVTNDQEIAEKAKMLRDMAFEKDRRFWHRHLGYNYRMTNLQAALGVAQMKKIDQFVEARRRCARIYNELLSEIKGITTPPEEKWAKNVYWMYSILIEKDFGLSRDRLMEILLQKYGIETRTFFYPIHSQPIYLEKYGPCDPCPVAEELSQKGINLPSGNRLREETIEYVVNAIKAAKKLT